MNIAVGDKYIHTSNKRTVIIKAVRPYEIDYQYALSNGSSGLFRRGVKTTQTVSREQFGRWFVPTPP